MKKILYLVFILIFLVGCSGRNDKINKESEATEIVEKEDPKNESKTEKKKTKEGTTNDRKEITDEDKRQLQATTQIAMGDYGFSDNTSSQLKNWNFALQQGKDSLLWITTTNDEVEGRVKTIFAWNGVVDDESEMILIYLLIGGEEIVNTLSEYQ